MIQALTILQQWTHWQLKPDSVVSDADAGLRLFAYHVPGWDLVLADGLSRLCSTASYVRGNGAPDPTLHAMHLDVANAAVGATDLDQEDLEDLISSPYDEEKWKTWLQDPWYRAI